MFERRNLWRSTAVAGLMVAAVACSSCNGAKMLYPVHAQVFFEGQPATGALVVLHPVDDTSPTAIRPSGYVDETGHVKLSSYISATRSTADGAPAGEYIVTIAWLPTDVKDYLSKHPNAELPDKLKARYSRPDSSNLRATVLAHPTDLPRIDLKKESAALPALKRPVSHRAASSSAELARHRGGFTHG